LLPVTKNIHFLREDTYQQAEHTINKEAPVEFRKVVEAKGDFMKAAQDSRIPDKVVCIGTKTTPEE
jgi:hypothetical protein